MKKEKRKKHASRKYKGKKEEKNNPLQKWRKKKKETITKDATIVDKMIIVDKGV